MSRPKFIRVKGWRRNPDKTGPKWLRWKGWKRNATPIIARSEWGARAGDSRQIDAGAWRTYSGVTLVVHHTVTPPAASQSMADASRAVRIVQGVHAGNAGGIGYGYLVAGGRLFEGRGFERVAAAAFDSARGVGWNRGPYVHAAIVGDYTKRRIHPDDLRALDDLIWHLGRLGVSVKSVIGHGDLMPTACPGTQGRKDLARYFGKRWKGKRA